MNAHDEKIARSAKNVLSKYTRRSALYNSIFSKHKTDFILGIKFNNLNINLINEWLIALRSGKYKQGYRRLRREDKINNEITFCCLGVLGDISGIDTKTLNNDTTLPDNCNINSLVELLTTPIISEKSGVVKRNTLQSFFANLNDSGYTFNEIADVIEYIFIIRPKNAR